MRKLYRAILKLYPAQYRAVFALEMTDVFEQATVDFRKQGRLRLLLFAAGEYLSLLKGALVQHVIKRAAGDAYISSRCSALPGVEIENNIPALESHLTQLIRSMEFAIAHHNFSQARLRSNQEREVRARLERLRTAEGLNRFNALEI